MGRGSSTLPVPQKPTQCDHIVGQEGLGAKNQTWFRFDDKPPIWAEGRLYLGGHGEQHSEFLPQDLGVVDFHYLLQEALGVAVKFEAAVIPKPPDGSLEPIG